MNLIPGRLYAFTYKNSQSRGKYMKFVGEYISRTDNEDLWYDAFDGTPTKFAVNKYRQVKEVTREQVSIMVGMP